VWNPCAAFFSAFGCRVSDYFETTYVVITCDFVWYILGIYNTQDTSNLKDINELYLLMLHIYMISCSRNDVDIKSIR